ncbi:MAG: DmsE family decaheme c-type cytochrome [Acidobacteria bacterium]|nr:DmsE family decaheme c-type cytochrome [Acidobacteriota bacterium]
MLRHRWTWLAGATGTLALAIGWSVVSAKTPAKPVDWAALNPAFAGATFVNNPETCRTCHEDAMAPYAHTTHALAFGTTPPETSGECESCHGPRSAHVENPTAELRIDRSSKAGSAICLQCHQGKSRFGWKAGAHHSNDVSCSSCHAVMAKKSERALLVKATVTETCYQCHGEVRAETNKMSHHPVREGRMDCAACHNAHGGTPRLLIKPTVNETCVTCHAEKRGPFVWEHAPARESCATCHTPHGSNQRNLLTAKDPFLCLSCHNYGGHINLPRYNRVSNPYGNGCSNCHLSVHGSNHPSGAKLTR